MSATAIDRKRLLARLHMAKAERGLDDETYRDLLERETGARSAKDLDTDALARVLDHITGSGVAAAGRPSAVVATGIYAPKLKALWLSGWHLGVVRNRTDAALIAFVKRQTGLEHTRFLREPAAARKAVEALKAWLARDAGVAWGEAGDNPRAAVVEAQWRRLGELGAIKVFVPGEDRADALARYASAICGGKQALKFLSEEDWDRLIQALGGKLRRALAETRVRGTETATDTEGTAR
jgi:hypothetical protein